MSMLGNMYKWLSRNSMSAVSALAVCASLLAFAFQLQAEWRRVAIGILGAIFGGLSAALISYLIRWLSKPLVFISYAAEDFEFAAKLADDLRELNVEPIIDRVHLKVGDNVRTAVDKMIDRSDYVVVIISEGSKESTWAQKEIEYARKHTKRILPVVRTINCIPSDIEGLFYADFSNNYAAGFEQLARTFKA